MRRLMAVAILGVLGSTAHAAEVCITVPDAAVPKVQEACVWYSTLNSIDPPVQGAVCARHLLRHHIKALLAGQKRHAGEARTRNEERQEYQDLDQNWPD